MDNKAQNRALYLAWLKQTAPPLYFNAVNSAADSPKEYSSGALAGFWDTVGDTFASVTKNVSAALPALATTYAGYQNSKDLIALNTQRANQGYAPVTYDSSGNLVPVNGANYGVTAQQMALAQSASTTNMIMIGIAAAILLVIVLRK